MRLGMHLATGKSLASAAERGGQIGCRALQIFSGNPRGWSKPPLDPRAVAAFKAAVQAAGIDPVVVHATYLINLAAPDENIYALSVTAFLDELKRSGELGARFYVVHCGSHKGTGEIPARERVRAALAKACALPAAPVVLLENTAGTSNSMGTSLHDLKALADGFPADRVGFCFDTCHALVAGFEIRTPEGAKDVLDEFDQVLGLARLRCLHLNDSKGDLHSRLDRHEHIGHGTLGTQGIQAFLGDLRLHNLPAILETPQDEEDDDLRDLRRAAEVAFAAGAIGKDHLDAVPAKATDGKEPKSVEKKTAPVAVEVPAKPVIVKPPALRKLNLDGSSKGRKGRGRSSKQG